MLRFILMAGVAGFFGLSSNAQIIDNFDSNILTNWFAQAPYSLTNINQELSVVATNAFNFQVFNKQSLNENFVAAKVLYLKVKTTSVVTIRVDLKDGGGLSTNASPVSITPFTDGIYHVYTLDFNNKFRQSFPSAALVDSTSIAQVIIFFNPAGPAFNGNVLIDSIGHKVSSFPLPLEFLKFSGEIRNNNIKLFFTVADEKNVDKYIVQRSSNNMPWKNIAELPALNTGMATGYSVTDINPSNEKNIYRVKMIQNSQSVIYSAIWVYQPDNRSIGPVLAHISRGSYQLILNSSPAAVPLYAEIYNYSGQRLQRKQLAFGEQELNINTSPGNLIVIHYKNNVLKTFRCN